MRMFEDADNLPISPYKAYLEESRKPIVCLIFSLPFFLSYHVGVWWMREQGQSAWANGADVLLGKALNIIGMGGPLISFFFVVVVFMFLQQASGKSLRFRGGTLALMVMESIVFALPPFFLGKVVTHLVDTGIPVIAASVAREGGRVDLFTYIMNLVLAVGAGVYEEFLFRMLLLGALFGVFRRVFRMEGTTLYVVAMITQAFLFALFHHLPGSVHPLSWEYVQSLEFMRAFAFRSVAGVYFAYLYQERGFGIAAGSHAFYDVVAVTLNAFR